MKSRTKAQEWGSRVTVSRSRTVLLQQIVGPQGKMGTRAGSLPLILESASVKTTTRKS